nr:hypothetical protein BaRGS_025042 [Batillaria attramentaria]
MVVFGAFNASRLSVTIVVIWAPSETRFNTDDVNKTLHDSLTSDYNVRILQEHDIFHYFVKEFQNSTSQTIFIDLREYACPDDIAHEHVLAYVSVTQMSCPFLSNATRSMWTRVDTRTFERGHLVAELTDATNKTTSSLALLFDQTGEEYFHERTSGFRRPLVFEISVALEKCAATEQLKNLTAKTEIRDVVVVAKATCISELLSEAANLQLMFGRYRWLLYPTDGSLPACSSCQQVNGVVLVEKHRPEQLPDTGPEKILRFVEKSVGILEDMMANDSKLRADCHSQCDDKCHLCVEAFKEATEQVAGEGTMVFLQDNNARKHLDFDLFQMTEKGPMKKAVAEWSESRGLRDMNGVDLFPHSTGNIVLRAVVVMEPPFVFREKTPEGFNYSGYSLDVLDRIAKEVGFTFVVRECDNNEYGVYSHGEWSGCIGNVMRGEADVIVGALTVTAEREEVVDFTLPYYDFAGIQILMKKPDTSVSLFYFADVFTLEAWLCLLGVIVLTSFLLFLFERFSPKPEDRVVSSGSSDDDSLTPRAFDLKESIWFVIGSVTLAGGGEPPRCLSSRLLVAGFWFFSVVIMSTFTANLAAFLTVSRMGATIASLDALAAQSDVKYSVVRMSNVMAYFEHQAAIERNFYELWKNMSLGGAGSGSENVVEQNLAVWDYPLGDKFGNMWDAMKKTGLLNSTQEGLEKVLGGNFALITESPVIKYLLSQDCSLTSVGDQFSVRPYAFALKEKSLFTSKFTAAILQLQKERKLESLKRKWWDDNKVNCPAESRDQGLDLSSLTGTFIVMGGGLCLGLIVLAVEFLLSRRTNARRKTDGVAVKEAEGTKVLSSLDPGNQGPATLDQLAMARELKKKLEMRQSM